MKKVAEWKLEQDLKEFKDSFRKRIIEAINNAKIKDRFDVGGKNPDRSDKEMLKELITKISSVNNDFGGNALICSAEANAILQDSIYFVPNYEVITTEQETDFKVKGFEFAGMFGALFFYVDYYLPAPIILIVKRDFFTTENPEAAVIYLDNIRYFQ